MLLLITPTIQSQIQVLDTGEMRVQVCAASPGLGMMDGGDREGAGDDLLTKWPGC